MGYHDPNFTGCTDNMDDPHALFIPSPQEIASMVNSWRRLRSWKQETLAQFAAVSLSTIERIERGEVVSIESLDRVAVALGFKEGDFHRPRTRRSFDEAMLETMKFFEGTVAVPCAPLKTQPQAVALLNCHAYLIDDGRCSPDADEAVAILRENLGFYSFVLSELADPVKPVKRRDIYTSLLADVQAVERRGYTALHATYEANSQLGPITVALIAFFPKLTDPGAAKREFLFAPASFSKLTI
jgi:DNA-binding XRE family transcriptional regulator